MRQYAIARINKLTKKYARYWRSEVLIRKKVSNYRVSGIDVKEDKLEFEPKIIY